MISAHFPFSRAQILEEVMDRQTAASCHRTSLKSESPARIVSSKEVLLPLLFSAL